MKLMIFYFNLRMLLEIKNKSDDKGLKLRAYNLFKIKKKAPKILFLLAQRFSIFLIKCKYLTPNVLDDSFALIKLLKRIKSLKKN